MPNHFDQVTQLSAHRISAVAAAAYTGLAESTLNKMRMTGAGPRFLKISARRVVYDTRDLDDWLSTKRRRSTSDMSGDGQNI